MSLEQQVILSINQTRKSPLHLIEKLSILHKKAGKGPLVLPHSQTPLVASNGKGTVSLNQLDC